jgi:hypothetical protein
VYVSETVSACCVAREVMISLIISVRGTSGLRKPRLTAVGIRCADHATLPILLNFTYLLTELSPS